MNNYRLTVRLKSPVITPFLADTFFGHIAWAHRYINGEQALKDFLEEYGNSPPLILSNGFPENFIARPFAKSIDLKDEKKLLNDYFPGNMEKGFSALKKLKKYNFIHLNTFEKLSGNYSDSELYKLVFEEKLCPDNFRERPEKCSNPLEECTILNSDVTKPCPYIEEKEKRELVSHNTINRITNTVSKEGGFYQQYETFYIRGARFHFYLKITEKYVEHIKKAVEFISQYGYGKDKSTGKGNLEIVEDLREYNFRIPENANSFMSISNFVPAENDPVDGCYSIMTKFGKLGGDYAKSAVDGENQLIPFKKPLIMFNAGSFFSVQDTGKEHFGRMINGIHKNEKIIHYGLAYPVYFKRGENENV